MADRSIKLSVLKRILAQYGIECCAKCGKGSHVLFFKSFPEGKRSYPIPTHGTDVKVGYLGPIRKKFNLTPTDGVSDNEFYSKG